MAYNQNYGMAIAVFLSLNFLAVSSTSTLLCKSFADCLSLLRFKEGITSDPDGHLQAWNESASFCNWTGITCHKQLKNRVIAIELVNMRLGGVVSPYISNLSRLTSLSLQGNSFYGEIPTAIGELSELIFINMSDNKLEGSIPGSIQGCWSLETIDLNYNNLSGRIPAAIGQMTNLTYLCLSQNSLTGVIPSFLSNLTELTDLELQVNYFTGKIPKELGKLTKLEILYLHMNFLEGSIPASISNCTALLGITLIENRLTGEIPFELGSKLHNLQRLYFQNNQLSGKIPVTLSNLSQLTLLDVSLNYLEGEVPPEFGKLKNLERLYLHSNNLVSGSNNSSLSFLTPLTNCSHLQKLHLGACFFAGSLPASVGSFSKDLYYLNLRNNKITGKLPAEIGNLSGLVQLDLWYNFLDGIPPTIGKLRQLQILHLGRNKLLGPIPDELGQMANLGLVELSDNLIPGPIPTSLGKLSQLRYLYLSHNHLTGKIPIELTQCSLLMLLDLSFNNLQGSLPSDIGLFSNLALSLNLSNNNLQGEIPASIGNLASVQAIDLSKNKFSRGIPSLLGRCISLEYLNLSNNMLEGTIPDSLKQIIHLQVIDLAFNNLTGSVPFWIGESRNIKNLNLSYNRLTGEVSNIGRFKNFGRSSFMGNMGLCGGSKLMGLPPCEVQKQQHKKRKWVYYLLTMSITCTLFFFLLVAIIVRRVFFKHRSAEPEIAIPMDSPEHHGIRTLTQRELEIATGGFDEANILGKGSFGTVYKAIIGDGKTVVAVKVLQENCSQGYRSFTRECQILSGIKHRNLVRMIGSTWNSEFKAIVLEYIGNGSLDQHLYPSGSEEGECELKLIERMGIAIDIAHGLGYLHEECPVQVVHCDLKPQNVLLDHDMVAHVADFGIGKLISSDKPKGYVTSTTAFLRGSVGYIPPEYAQGIDVSTRGDVYSFGVMMLEMITRKRPTNDMFLDGLNLRKWVCSAFPNHVLDIVDISLKHEAYLEEGSGALHKLEQCCIHMLDAGVMCTEVNPHRRPPISLVAQRLKKVWKEMGFGTLWMEKEEKD